MKYALAWFFALLIMSVLNFYFGFGFATGERITHNLITGAICVITSILTLLVHFKVIKIS